MCYYCLGLITQVKVRNSISLAISCNNSQAIYIDIEYLGLVYLVLILLISSVFSFLYLINTSCCNLFVKKSFRAVDISSNLCGISGVKVWDHLIKGFPNLH